MNNLQKLIIEYALDRSSLSNTITLLILIPVLLILILSSSSKISKTKFVLSFFGILFVASFIMYKIDINAKLSDGSTILKEDYNIEMKEKDNNIELNFNKKEESSDFFKDNFKVFLEKTNEEKYYVYFDENKKNKKEVSLNEIKETFNNVNKVESKKFSLSEINNEERK